MIPHDALKLPLPFLFGSGGMLQFLQSNAPNYLYLHFFQSFIWNKKQMKYTNLIESVGFWLPINPLIGETSRNTAATWRILNGPGPRRDVDGRESLRGFSWDPVLIPKLVP